MPPACGRMQAQAFFVFSAQKFGPYALPWRQPLRRVFPTWFSARTGTEYDSHRVHDVKQASVTTDASPRPRSVTLRDIFAPKRSPSAYKEADKCLVINAGDLCRTDDVSRKREPLHRLNRLQEVANLALEGRRPGKAWGCADIGADHGLLAICLHANDADVVAGDRAAGPLGVASENIRVYLRHARTLAATGALETRAADERSSKSSADGGHGDRREGSEMAQLRRLECRLGEGLSVLEEGEVDTVCIAGMGVNTIIQILSESRRSTGRTDRHDNYPRSSALSTLKIERLVIQPVDARLEFVHALRVWLRENGWQITQETISSTVGKGGRRAYVTLRADSVACQRNGHLRKAEALNRWPGGYQEGADWLGEFLPARATDADRLRGGEKSRRERREAPTFLAYLRHQRDWLRAIEVVRSTKGQISEDARSVSKRTSYRCVVSGLDHVTALVETALQVQGTSSTDSIEPPLVTSRKWRRTYSRLNDSSKS